MVILNSNLLSLIIGILKAIIRFILRLLLLIPMIVIGVIGVAVSGESKLIGETIVRCLVHPFIAFAEAMRSISYEVKEYRNNK